MNTHAITRDDLLLFLTRSDAFDFTTLRFHLVVANQFIDADHAVILDQETASELLSVNPRQFRRIKKNALEDGYWNSVRGYRGKPSTYAPTNKLINAVLDNKLAKDS